MGKRDELKFLPTKVERENILAAVELLRQAAFASYDDNIADFPIANDNTVYIFGMPRYFVFMACERAMLRLMERVWGFAE
jgi:hypothetical protein